MIKSSILIIGRGNSEYMNAVIGEPASIEEAEEMYGIDSEICTAYKEAVSTGCSNISILNVYKASDYIKAINTILNKKFSYIVPLFSIKEKYVSKVGKEYYVSNILSEAINESVIEIIYTSKHCELFENVQHYTDYINSEIYDYKETITNDSIDPANVCYVANNLKNNKYANVILASILSQSDKSKYPKKDVDKTVMELDHIDFINNECIFFTYNHINGLMPNRLYNFQKDNDFTKFIPNKALKSMIEELISVEEFYGKQFTAHTKILINNKISEVLKDVTGTLVEDARLVEIKQNIENGYVTLKTIIKIKPFLYAEYFYLEMEI